MRQNIFHQLTTQMSTLILYPDRFSENENKTVKAHIPQHRNTKTKKPRHRDSGIKTPRPRETETKPQHWILFRTIFSLCPTFARDFSFAKVKFANSERLSQMKMNES